MNLNKTFKNLSKVLLTLSLFLVLTACSNNFKELNEYINTIDYEEEGYILFTNDEKVDGDNKIILEDVIVDIFNSNNITYEFINYYYYLINDLIHFDININNDNNNILTKAILVVDAKELKAIFLKTIYEGKKGVDVYNNNDNNILIVDNNKEEATNYIYKNNTYEKIVLNEFDLNNHTYKEVTEMTKNNTKYYIESIYPLIIESNNNEIFFESNNFELFKNSKVGKEIYDYSLEIDNELTWTNNVDEYFLFMNKNELYITYKFKSGFLFNKNLLGETKSLAFRFDFESKSLKYIGKAENINAIYYE